MKTRHFLQDIFYFSPKTFAVGFFKFQTLRPKRTKSSQVSQLNSNLYKNCVDPFYLVILSVLSFALFTNESLPFEGHAA